MRELNRRDFLSSIALAAAAVTMPKVTFGAGADKSQTRPNIVLFLSDDHSLIDAGCYGNDIVQTPNIDKLASRGMRFTHAFTASPTCVPCRSLLYTGLYPHKNGAHPNHSSVRRGIRSLPHYLSPLGYRVALVGKKHISPEEAFPFEILELPKDNALRFTIGKRLDKFFTEAEPAKPFCLVVATYDPHVKWADNQIYDPEKVKLPPYLVDTEDTRKAMTNYYTDITRMDTVLGTTLEMLKKHGLDKNTLFIYASDQGAQWPHAKWNLYDAGINTPFIVRCPGKIKPATVTDAMISFVDVLPTFIELAGGKPIESLDGTSFLPVLLGKKKSHRDVIYATHTRDGSMNFYPMRAIRTRTHKYILNLNPERAFTSHITNVYLPRKRGAYGFWESWMLKANSDPSAAKRVKL